MSKNKSQNWQSGGMMPPGIQVVISIPHNKKTEAIQRMKKLAAQMNLQMLIPVNHIDELDKTKQYYEIIVTVKKPVTDRAAHDKVSAKLLHFQSILMTAVTASNMPIDQSQLNSLIQ